MVKLVLKVAASIVAAASIVVEPIVVEPIVVEPIVVEPIVVEPIATELMATAGKAPVVQTTVRRKARIRPTVEPPRCPPTIRMHPAPTISQTKVPRLQVPTHQQMILQRLHRLQRIPPLANELRRNSVIDRVRRDACCERSVLTCCSA
jgi:hypothetical protein